MNKKRILTLLIAILLMVLAGCSKSDFPIGTIMADRNPKMKITFSEDGTYKYHIPGMVVAQGNYVIKGDKIIFESDSYCRAVYDGAVYRWDVSGNIFTFIPEKIDGCKDRRETLEGVWRLEKYFD